MRSNRGQAMLEFALVVPVVALLAFGGLYVTLLIGNDLKAGYAVGEGARLASQLGGRQGNPTAATADIDARIVGDVLTVMHGTAYVTIDEIDVYRVTSADGTMQPGDLADTFDGTGKALPLQSFPLELRLQSPPDDTPIGVRMRWHFTTPVFNFGTASTSTYAVMRTEPITS